MDAEIKKRLSLTEPVQSEAMTASQQRELRGAIKQFYAEAMSDPLLGPMFETHVRDWDAHLATMLDFWSAAIYRTGRYQGRPLERHRALPGLTGEHFKQWFALWETTVRNHVNDPPRTQLIAKARQMANSMQARLHLPES